MVQKMLILNFKADIFHFVFKAHAECGQKILSEHWTVTMRLKYFAHAQHGRTSFLRTLGLFCSRLLNFRNIKLLLSLHQN